MKYLIITTQLFQGIIIRKMLQLKLTNNIRQAKNKMNNGKEAFIVNIINKTIKNMR